MARYLPIEKDISGMKFPAETRAAAEALYHALTEDAFYITMEESVTHENSPREAMFRYMEYSMAEAGLYGELFFPKESCCGAAIWSKPLSAADESRKDRAKELFIQKEMGENSFKTYKAIVDFMSAHSAPVVSPKSWYLSILGLAPEDQNRGLGSSLIKNTLEKTDGLGVETYLETFTPQNMSFYERQGYKETAFFDEPTTGARYWLMTRKPGAGNRAGAGQLF